jgi:hypothetical protein
MLTSLDGYTEDEHGHFGWGAPEDAEVHSYINKLAARCPRFAPHHTSRESSSSFLFRDANPGRETGASMHRVLAPAIPG